MKPIVFHTKDDIYQDITGIWRWRGSAEVLHPYDCYVLLGSSEQINYEHQFGAYEKGVTA